MTTRDDDAPLRSLTTGFRNRTLVTIGLASKLGAKMVKKTLGRGEPAREGDPADDGEAERGAAALVEQIGQLKGLVMKFGQMASYLDGTLPPNAQRVLARLQSQSQPLAFDRITSVIETEFGMPVSDLFEHLDPKAIAAASIGQVHLGRLDGRDVVVKVQYPGVEEVLRSDLSTVGTLARLGTLTGPMDGKALAEELRARILEECDYLGEAENQQLFRSLIGGDVGKMVPEVFPHRTRRRVITSAFVDGVSFQRFVDEADQKAKDRAAALVFETCFTCIMQHCIYNADPHPGNYLFRRDGSVAFLDFGCVRRFDPRMIDDWKAMALAFIRGDRKTAKEKTIALGLAPDSPKYDWEYHWSVLDYLYAPFTSKEPFTYHNEYVAKSYDLIMWKNPNKYRTPFPAAWLFLNRLQWGLNSILAQLRATGPWGQLWRQALESPTSPQLRSAGG